MQVLLVFCSERGAFAVQEVSAGGLPTHAGAKYLIFGRGVASSVHHHCRHETSAAMSPQAVPLAKQ